MPPAGELNRGFTWLVPKRLKLSLLINHLIGKRLGYAGGQDGKARVFPFFLPVISFVKEPVLVFHAKYL